MKMFVRNYFEEVNQKEIETQDPDGHHSVNQRYEETIDPNETTDMGEDSCGEFASIQVIFVHGIS